MIENDLSSLKHCTYWVKRKQQDEYFGGSIVSLKPEATLTCRYSAKQNYERRFSHKKTGSRNRPSL